MPNISRVQTITATVTGYYDTPSGSMGQNRLKVFYTDATEVNLGTYDAWTASASGQILQKGDAGDETVAADVVDVQYTITVPYNKTVDRIELRSSYVDGYPESDRGIKNITVTYR